MRSSSIYGYNPEFPYGARIRSTGIVAAIHRNPVSAAIEHVVVCSAALGGASPRQTSSARRVLSPILIEYVMAHDETGMQADEISCGDIVEGVGVIRNVCDDFLMVVPIEELKITRFDNQKYQKAYFRLTGAQRFAIRSFAATCNEHNKIFWDCTDVLADNACFNYFSCLFSEKKEPTLAYIEAEGILISGLTVRGSEKWQIWLLASAFPQHKYQPILVSCKARGGHGHEFGSVFALKIPVISTIPQWSRASGRYLPVSVIGGVARASRIPLSDTAQIAFFHALYNLYCAPKDIAAVLLGKLGRAKLKNHLLNWGLQIDNSREILLRCVHGWWGEGYWDLSFHIHKTGNFPFKAIFTNYSDGDGKRIMIVKDGDGDLLDAANERTWSVSLDDPIKILEGPRPRPNELDWYDIRKWIEMNREVLCKNDYFDDYGALRYL